MCYKLNGKYNNIEEIIATYPDKRLKVDLGCGFYKPKGYIGIDDLRGETTQVTNQENMPDIFMDLNLQPLPFRNGSCAEVRASHFLEHSDIDHIISEVHRVLAPSGKFNIIVPYANSAEGMYPGHTLFLTEKWFYENLHFQKCFEIIHEKYYPSSTYKKLPLLLRFIFPFRYARLFLFNACWQMKLICRVRK